MKLLLLIPLIFFSLSIKAQSQSTEIGTPNKTPTVIKDGERLFDKDVLEQKIRAEKNQKEQELDAIVTRLNLSDKIYDWGNYATWDNKEKLNKQIAINEKIAYTYDKNAAIFKLCNEIESLDAQLKGSKFFDGACKKHTYNRQQARKNANNAIIRINKLIGIIKKETQDKNTHQAEMNLLDKELQEVTNNSKNLSAQLDAINNKNTSTSLDDFLASNNSNTSNDFLAEPASNNDDFLNGSSKGSSDDFLSETNHSTDFKITSKDGLTGVVNAKGNVLIPFKSWSIVEYKMGIAKVSTVVANKSFNAGSCVGFANAKITKMGFVNSLGDYITDPTLTSYVSWQSTACLKLVSNDDYYNVNSERYRAKEKREKEYKKEQAKNEAQKWALNYIR
tara:strand:+ start:69 stop:1241 length:1173 start_codon:yes stop_codon:yes gene_type:complete